MGLPMWPVEARSAASAPAGDVVPVAGQVVSVALSMGTFAALAACLTRRLQLVDSWRLLPLTSWLLLLIYIDSSAFVFITALLTKGFDMNGHLNICHAILLLCLVCYLSTKVLIYLFLVEKAYIIRGTRQPRFKNKLYLINFFGMICPYMAVGILNFVYRFAYLNKDGMCIVGMKRFAMIPLLSWEVMVNVYLTIQMVLPLRKLYSFRNEVNDALRSIAFRTFIGSCATLTSSVANITTLLVLQGEPGWICMMCCNADILFSVLVLHWVTSNDNRSHRPTSRPSPNSTHLRARKRARPDPILDRPFDGTGGTTFFSHSPYALSKNCCSGSGTGTRDSWALTSSQPVQLQLLSQQHPHSNRCSCHTALCSRRSALLAPLSPLAITGTASQASAGSVPASPTAAVLPTMTTLIEGGPRVDAGTARMHVPRDSIAVRTEQVRSVEIERRPSEMERRPSEVMVVAPWDSEASFGEYAAELAGGGATSSAVGAEEERDGSMERMVGCGWGKL